MSSNIELGNDRVWSSDIRRAEKIGDRGFRKWISEGRFPRPDGNLFGRNFWLRATFLLAQRPLCVLCRDGDSFVRTNF